MGNAAIRSVHSMWHRGTAAARNQCTPVTASCHICTRARLLSTDFNRSFQTLEPCSSQSNTHQLFEVYGIPVRMLRRRERLALQVRGKGRATH